MHIGTNKPGAKLTRPVPGWKRFLFGVGGVAFGFLTVGAFTSGAGWVTLVPRTIKRVTVGGTCAMWVMCCCPETSTSRVPCGMCSIDP